MSWGRLLAWGGVSLLVAATLVSFVMWGANGPAYLVELVAAYCF